VDPSVGLDAAQKKKTLHSWESNPGRTARGYTDWAIPDHIYIYDQLMEQDTIIGAMQRKAYLFLKNRSLR
jgi:hypothetical protein